MVGRKPGRDRGRPRRQPVGRRRRRSTCPRVGPALSRAWRTPGRDFNALVSNSIHLRQRASGRRSSLRAGRIRMAIAFPATHTRLSYGAGALLPMLAVGLGRKHSRAAGLGAPARRWCSGARPRVARLYAWRNTASRTSPTGAPARATGPMASISVLDRADGVTNGLWRLPRGNLLAAAALARGDRMERGGFCARPHRSPRWAR